MLGESPKLIQRIPAFDVLTDADVCEAGAADRV